MLATQGYPSWYQNHVKPMKKEYAHPPFGNKNTWLSNVEEHNGASEEKTVKKWKTNSHPKDGVNGAQDGGAGDIVGSVQDAVGPLDPLPHKAGEASIYNESSECLDDHVHGKGIGDSVDGQGVIGSRSSHEGGDEMSTSKVPVTGLEAGMMSMLKRNIGRCYSDLKPNVLLRNCIGSLRSQDLCK